MKLMWLGYLVYSLGNCAMKLYIKIDLISLMTPSSSQRIINTFNFAVYIYAEISIFI